MIRKLAIALSLLGACFTGFVHALGLGEVTVKSALNQPLKAEIELVNTAGLTIDEILPGLATREEFQRANVDRVYFLSDLRFEVIANTQGKATIVLTSKKPVREPFLNFIVELIWPSGRLLREYALLIDPPLFSDQPSAKVSSPSTKSTVSGDVLTVPNNATDSNTRPLLAPVQKIQTETYGATSANDTLWDIAIKARPNRSVSPQQVMLAIQDLNPGAFIDDNINKLKAGMVLRLPTIEQIKQRSQHQAIVGVIAQNEALSGKKTPSVVQGSIAKNTTSKKEQQNTAPAVSKVSGDELKLVVSDNNTAPATNSANSGQSNQAGSGAANDLAITLEKLDKASIENKELNSRVGDLEEQLSTLQRLLTLKNDQLASIQSQMRASELAKLKNENEATNTITQEASSIADTQDSSVSVDSADKAEDITLTAEQEKLVNDIPSKVGDSDVQALSSQAETDSADVQESTQNEAGVDSTVPVSQNTADTSSKNIIETIINNPVYLSISIIFILILVFILWMISRYNAKREEEFHSQNAYEHEIDNVEFDEGIEEEGNSEFDTQPLNSIDENDSDDSFDEEESFTEQTEDETQDVIAEVDAYISYGRLDQAAQVLEKAISEDPVRTDYRLKLLEIYKDSGDRQAFDRQFSELEAIQDSTALSAAELIKSNMLEEEGLQVDLEKNDLSTELDSYNNIEAQDIDTGDVGSGADDAQELKEFDFDSVSLDEGLEEEDLSTELDLDDLDLDSETSGSVVDSELADEADDTLEAIDNLELAEATEAETPESLDFDDSILDVELEDLDLNTELEQETEIPLEQDSNVEEAGLSEASSEDLLVSDDILEEATQAFEEDVAVNALDESLSDEDEFDFLNGTDEVSTKLDLARAYIDMGDLEGAKDILLEVTKEGTDSQQAEAKELIDSID